ncbi:MAG: uncharacterized protein H6Q07_3471 [Acidobacteria bacterium]|nr:uncharacterized protein [Acidobacteriota bacterium]
MNILISGASGLIGSALASHLAGNQHRVFRMIRRKPAAAGEIAWDPASETLDKSAVEGMDAVVHLAGTNLASGRWTAERKRSIRESRIAGTLFLAQSLARLFDPPKVFVSVSAIGYYGNGGDSELVEESPSGKGFLADLCREWETATEPASARHIRVVIPRLGMVLSPGGGALRLMLPIFRLGAGGRIGSGRQYMSWIAIDDLVGVIDHAIHCEGLRGPVNAVSPNPVTNQVFSKTLGAVLSRPALFALPAFAARLALGQMADEVLLSGARVSPAKLTGSGYSFVFPHLEGALRHVLKRPGKNSAPLRG